jgi:hypothetical protein
MAITAARSTIERPIVTMITAMIGWPIIGRSATRSTTRPSRAENASVSKNAGTRGTP